MGGGLCDDEAHQIGVEAGQGEQRPGHHPPHGVTNENHTLGGGLQVLAGREREKQEVYVITLTLLTPWVWACYSIVDHNSDTFPMSSLSER